MRAALLAAALLRAALVVATVPLAAGEAGAEPARVALRLGVIAEEPSEPDRMLRVFGALLTQLRERLAPSGVDVAGLVVARDVDDLAQKIARAEVDLVIETVFPTLMLQARSSALSPGFVVVRRGQRAYRTVFFTKAEAKIKRLTDLRGRTLVLQVLRSTSAFALPKAELERAGLSLGSADDSTTGPHDVRYVFAMSEVNQAVWVLHGRGDAGAFSDANWAALPERIRSQLRIFHQTEPIVRGLLSFRTGIDARARRLAVDALTSLNQDDAGRAALAAAAGITRIEPLTAADRRELRELAAVLHPGVRR